MIDEEIRRASTLPGEFYRSAETYSRVREEVFAKSWLFLADRDRMTPGLQPVILGRGSLDEPLILSSDSCFSNVCTHRGAILLEAPCPAQNFRCRYHGRRFDRDGRFLSMPEFEEAESFPSEKDDLPRVKTGAWGPLIFAAIDPALEFADWIAPLARPLSFSPDQLRFTGERIYQVEANWALYCDNYLEGFHIPFVHPELAGAIDYATYRTELFDHASLQIGEAKTPGEEPAYYFFLFPSTMVNVYAWGISLNVIEPLGAASTRIRFLTFVADASKTSSASADLDKVELQDEEVVQSVQRGVRSRLYQRGRYSPTREVGVHHFHRLLLRYSSSAR